jgi:transcriptional regulator with XRE-family HTH domain
MLGYVPVSAPMRRGITADLERGFRFLLLRKGLGWTQQTMADLVGVSQSSWTQYEHGVKRPGWDTLVKIHKVTRCPPAYLMEGDATSVPGDILQKIELARRELIRNHHRKRN